MRCALLALLVISCGVAVGQLRNAHWLFCDNHVSFASGSAVVSTQLHGGHNNAAILSDPVGQLLVYALQDSVHNAMHGPVANVPGSDPYPPAFQQGLLLLPWPGSDHDAAYFYNEYAAYLGPPGRCGYSRIDLTAGGGQGAFVGDMTWFMDSSTCKLTAVPHANGEDYWVLVQRWGTDEIIAWQLTTNGLEPQPVVSHCGEVYSQWVGANEYPMRDGPLAASYGGDVLAICAEPSPAEGLDSAIIQVLSFDPATGSAARIASIPPPVGKTVDGLEFSPDGSKLYMITTDAVAGGVYSFHQYDLTTPTEAAIVASHLVLTMADSDYLFGQPELQMVLAPDGRIYFENTLASTWLGVIMAPNELGSACGLVLEYLELPFTGGCGLPNQCRRYHDSELNTSVSDQERDRSPQAWPVPATHHVQLSLASMGCFRGTLHMHNATGALVATRPVVEYGSTLSVDLQDLPVGLLHIRYDGDYGERCAWKVLKQ